jgi:hypothetical protein
MAKSTASAAKRVVQGEVEIPKAHASLRDLVQTSRHLDVAADKIVCDTDSGCRLREWHDDSGCPRT